jgi:hypothetical protein
MRKTKQPTDKEMLDWLGKRHTTATRGIDRWMVWQYGELMYCAPTLRAAIRKAMKEVGE